MASPDKKSFALRLDPALSASGTRGSLPCNPNTPNWPGVKLNSPASARTRRIMSCGLMASRPTTVAL